MDTTKEYMNMCLLSKEIQLLKKLDRDGDWYFHDYGKHFKKNRYNIFVNCDYLIPDEMEYTHDATDDDIWLPRQDQLQEICWSLTETKWTPYFTLTMVRDFAEYRPFETMERLWLAFVMKEKYHKEWNGNDWILQS